MIEKMTETLFVTSDGAIVGLSVAGYFLLAAFIILVAWSFLFGRSEPGDDPTTVVFLAVLATALTLAVLASLVFLITNPDVLILVVGIALFVLTPFAAVKLGRYRRHNGR